MVTFSYLVPHSLGQLTILVKLTYQEVNDVANAYSELKDILVKVPLRVHYGKYCIRAWSRG